MRFNIPALPDIQSPPMLATISVPMDRDLLVFGAPGTGKTVVAYHRYLRAVSEGKNVVFLCYNKLLQYFLSKKLNRALTFDAWFYNLAKIVGGGVSKEGSPYVFNRDTEDISGVFEDFVRENGKYDLIIVDEGQDMSEAFVKALPIITRNVSIYMDVNQQVRKPDSVSIEDAIREAFPECEEATLVWNFRNTREICQFATEKFLPNHMRAQELAINSHTPSIPETEPKMERNLQWNDMLEKIVQEIAATRERDGTVGILFPNVPRIGEASAFLDSRNIDHDRYISKEVDSHDLFLERPVLLTSYDCSKGLEFDYVIVVVIKDEVDTGKISSQLYVVTTRGRKGVLFLFDY